MNGSQEVLHKSGTVNRVHRGQEGCMRDAALVRISRWERYGSRTLHGSARVVTCESGKAWVRKNVQDCTVWIGKGV